jgi:hypothetical protein
MLAVEIAERVAEELLREVQQTEQGPTETEEA